MRFTSQPGCLAACGVAVQSIIAALFQGVMCCTGSGLCLYSQHIPVSQLGGVGEECTVACQPVLFDCQPNKPNGNSPLEREREAHWDTEEEKPRKKEAVVGGGCSPAHSYVRSLCRGKGGRLQEQHQQAFGPWL